MRRAALARRSWRGKRVPPEPSPGASEKAGTGHEPEPGPGERPPWLLFAATMLVIAVVAATIMALSFLAYYLA